MWISMSGHSHGFPHGNPKGLWYTNNTIDIVDQKNSASDFEFKLNKRAVWDGDKNLRGARKKRGKKVAKGLRLK